MLLVKPEKSKVIIEATILDEDNGRNQSPLTPINNVNGVCSMNRSLVADIEGLKMELVILQRQIEANSIEIARTKSRFDTIKVSEKSTEEIQIMSLKEKCHKQEQTIHPLEDRAKAAEQERDSLRLALCILMQNQNHQGSEQNSNEFLEVKKQKSKSGARQQKDLKNQSTTLRSKTALVLLKLISKKIVQKNTP